PEHEDVASLGFGEWSAWAGNRFLGRVWHSGVPSRRHVQSGTLVPHSREQFIGVHSCRSPVIQPAGKGPAFPRCPSASCRFSSPITIVTRSLTRCTPDRRR